MQAEPRVEILGEGVVAERLRQRLPALLPGVTFEGGNGGDGAPPPAAAAVLVTRLDRVLELGPSLRQRRDLLTVGLWRGTMYLGPFRSGSAPGCFACLVYRVAGTPHGPDLDASGAVLPGVPAGDGGWSPLSLATLPALVSLELAEKLRGGTPRTARGALIVDGEHGELAFEQLLPDSSCPVCGEAPSRRLPEWAGVEAARTPCDGQRLRTSDALALGRAFEGAYLNPRIGLVREIQVDLQSPFGTCYLDLPLKRQRAEPCIGRGVSYARAQAVALLEALERYCGWRRGGPREVITAPYSGVADRALDPSTLGLHPDECYDLPGYPFVRYDPDLPIDWVWGYSLGRKAPVLVPARYAFYGHARDGSPSFAYEVSNGCALGATLEEAVMHGLLELVERDSFLLTWYRKLALPEISTADLPDRGVKEMLRRAELLTNASIRLFLSTREHGIPSLFAVATGQASDGPRTLAAAAAHPNLGQAVSGLLYELSGLTLRMQSILAERRPDALAMLEDASRVRVMEDHALVNCLPGARERFAFLLEGGRRPISFAEAIERSGPPLPRSLELGQAVSHLVGRMLGAGLDVVVVEQTMSELGPAGLRCAKVIVPGLLSMTFGHAYRRTAGLPRLFAPDPAARATAAEAGALPHPFP